MVLLADDGVETTSDKIMGVTDAPAAGWLPICSLPLGRVLEGKNVMDMVLGRSAASLGAESLSALSLSYVEMAATDLAAT